MLKKNITFDNLFILEMANNHQGDVEHGLNIIRSFHEVTKNFSFQFSIKFQYRYIDTFVHPDFVNSKDIKLIKRFTETMLTDNQYKILKDEAEKLGFITMCTPFDEKSVASIEKNQYDIIKIPSCYFNDWPLLEKVVQTGMPIIASTAGAKLEEIDKVVSFFQHRKKHFALMHCVGEYPTSNAHLQLNQIDFLKKRYEGVPIGFSTHESPDNLDSIKIAVAKGSAMFEKHIGLKTDKYDLNAYSATPEQYKKWLNSALSAYEMCGIKDKRYECSNKEKQDLRDLHRGMYLKRSMKAGEKLSQEDIFFAMPNIEKQIVANEFSKYLELTLKKDIEKNGAILWDDVSFVLLRSEIAKITKNVQKMLNKAKIMIPNQVDVMISYHYGFDKFYEWGAVLINIINREYCKMLIVLFPNQKYPNHKHKMKEETLHILYGELLVTIKGEVKSLKAGDILSIEREMEHSFTSTTGVIFEEISTTYVKGDSYYEEEVSNNLNRKTELTYWPDWNNSK